MKARKAAAKQKREASAQSEGEHRESGEAEPQQGCQLWLLMELARELQAPTQKATTTQEIHSQETEEELPLMKDTETAAEPEAEQEEADQMRDTDEGWGNWSRAQRKKWKEKEAKQQSKKEIRGWG